MPELSTLLHEQPLLAGLTAETLAALIGSGDLVAFSTGEVLLREGDESDFALLIIEGELGVGVRTTYGDIPLNVVSGPVLLGDIGVIAKLPRTATVRARTPGRALRIAGAAFERIGQDNPAMPRHVLAQLGARVSAFNQAMGFYTNALAALERDDLDPRLLDELRNPPAELLGFAVTFRKMADQIVQRRTRRQELANAAAIQRTMLPCPLPADRDPARFVLHAEMRPAREVGGDFYDAFAIGGERLAVTIGDVSGKGVAASLFMAVCQTVMRLVLREDRELGDAVSHANDLLEASNTEMMFATFFGATLDLRTGALTYCNCGHNPPVLRRADGTCELLSGADPALAAMGGLRFATRTARLASGDRLLLFTDGVTEAHRADDALFGEARLLQVVRASGDATVGQLVRRVLDEVDAFAGGTPQFDDMALLALAYRSY